MSLIQGHANRKNAFTLIELLVVIAIIAVLMGLLLPAIQKVREATNRMNCANNLKQMGIAIHAYHNVYEKIPPSRICFRHATWAVLLMPFLEQEAIYRHWDLTKEYYYQTDEARQFSVKTYYCPTRRSPPQLSRDGDVLGKRGGGSRKGKHVPGALTDYACVSGDRDNTDDSTGVSEVEEYDYVHSKGSFMIADFVSEGGRGPAGGVTTDRMTCVSWTGRLSFVDVVDGLSNTFFIGEKHVLQGHLGQGDNGDGSGLPGRGDGSAYNGNWWRNFARVGGPPVAVGPAGVQPLAFPIAKSPIDKVPQAGTDEAANNFPRVFGSYHPGICQFLLGDGSVRVVNNEIEMTVLGRLNVRDDAQLIKDY